MGPASATPTEQAFPQSGPRHVLGSAAVRDGRGQLDPADAGDP
jgi:hypothetical protein